MDRTFSGVAYDIVNNRSFPVGANEEVQIDVEKYNLKFDKE